MVAGSLSEFTLVGPFFYVQNVNPCLLRNTKIKSINDTEILIQNIQIGDKIISPFTSTPQTVKRLLCNKVTFVENNNNMPICIPASFFSKNIPSEDVYISGHHRIIININEHPFGVQAFKLCTNFVSKNKLEELFPCQDNKLEYFHIELEDPRHPMIISNLPVESYQTE
jgi:hypothetical protein